MGTRREAREQALSLCYEVELRQADATDVLEELPVPADEYTQALVCGVGEHRPELDAIIDAAAEHWSVGRMAVVDRNLLRIGCFELTRQPEIPVAVVISEAVDLARRYSTDESGRFVNGVLSAVARTVRPESGERGA